MKNGSGPAQGAPSAVDCVQTRGVGQVSRFREVSGTGYEIPQRKFPTYCRPEYGPGHREFRRYGSRLRANEDAAVIEIFSRTRTTPMISR
jgi:hypothetical protein